MLYDGQDLFTTLGRLQNARALLTPVGAWMHNQSNTKQATGAWQRESSTLLIMRGNVQLAQGDLDGARDSYQQSKKIREKLAQADPSNAQWQRDVVVSFCKPGEVAVRAKKSKQAQAVFVPDLAIANELCQLDPTNATWRKDATWLEDQINQLNIS